MYAAAHKVVHNEAAYEAGIKRNIIANARKTWKATTPRSDEILAALDSGYDIDNGGFTNDFLGSLAGALEAYGKLLPAQSAAVLKGIDARAAKRAEWAAQAAKSKHVGTAGEKITLTLTCVHIISFNSQFGPVYINICKDADGNTVIYKGNAKGFPDKDETATITATVKYHDERDGVNQTCILRPKLAK